MHRPEIATIIHPYESGRPDAREPERRYDPRWSYPVIQLVAFHKEDQQATKEMLQAVRCQDISLGGISFFLSGPPPFSFCTLVLGRPPGLIFVRARVAHFASTGGSGREWKIGCQFIGKVDSLLGKEEKEEESTFF
jgi:hypothetical protein